MFPLKSRFYIIFQFHISSPWGSPDREEVQKAVEQLALFGSQQKELRKTNTETMQKISDERQLKKECIRPTPGISKSVPWSLSRWKYCLTATLWLLHRWCWAGLGHWYERPYRIWRNRRWSRKKRSRRAGKIRTKKFSSWQRNTKICKNPTRGMLKSNIRQKIWYDIHFSPNYSSAFSILDPITVVFCTWYQCWRFHFYLENLYRYFDMWASEFVNRIEKLRRRML